MQIDNRRRPGPADTFIIFGFRSSPVSICTASLGEAACEIERAFD